MHTDLSRGRTDRAGGLSPVAEEVLLGHQLQGMVTCFCQGGDTALQKPCPVLGLGSRSSLAEVPCATGDICDVDCALDVKAGIIGLAADVSQSVGWDQEKSAIWGLRQGVRINEAAEA